MPEAPGGAAGGRARARGAPAVSDAITCMAAKGAYLTVGDASGACHCFHVDAAALRCEFVDGLAAADDDDAADARPRGLSTLDRLMPRSPAVQRGAAAAAAAGAAVGASTPARAGAADAAAPAAVAADGAGGERVASAGGARAGGVRGPAVQFAYTLPLEHGPIVAMAFSGASSSYQQLVRTQSDGYCMWECESSSVLSASWTVPCTPAVSIAWAGERARCAPARVGGAH